MDSEHFKARLRAKGQVTIPPPVRALLGIEAGDDVTFWMNEAGQVVITKAQMIPPDQAWFWTERWQRMEREAQDDVEAGKTTVIRDPDELDKSD